MAFDEQLAARVRQRLSNSRLRFEEQRMMGELCVLVNGKACVGVEQVRTMARIDPAVYDRALKRNGCVPIDSTDRLMREFVFVTFDGLQRAADLKAWLDLALEFNPEAKASKKTSTRTASEPTRARLKTISRRQPR